MKKLNFDDLFFGFAAVLGVTVIILKTLTLIF